MSANSFVNNKVDIWNITKNIFFRPLNLHIQLLKSVVFKFPKLKIKNFGNFYISFFSKVQKFKYIVLFIKQSS